MLRTTSLLGLAFLTACASSNQFSTVPETPPETVTEPISLPIEALADRLATADVVFLAEQHNHDTLHDQYLRLLRALHVRRPELALSMEMFDRDDQSVIDAYLQSALSEESFREEAKLWRGYDEHYRPMVEYCKENGLPVIAANLPAELARRMVREGVDALADEKFMPESMDLDDEREFELFQKAVGDMSGHGGAGLLLQMFPAQVGRDEAMAQSIDEFLQSVRGERPLVVHVVGQFHVKERLGTYKRLADRRPGLDLRIVGTHVVDTIAIGGPDGEDYRFVVAVQPPADRTQGAIGRSDSDEDSDEPEDPHAEDPDLGGRPALGFTPGYDPAVSGAMIDDVRPDGPAERAGLQGGDVIVEMEGNPIGEFQDYNDLLNELSPGDKVQVRVKRGNELLDFEVTVGSR
ncbi:MAG: ChaN family lipoprotein [Planctomycetota bacterium]